MDDVDYANDSQIFIIMKKMCFFVCSTVVIQMSCMPLDATSNKATNCFFGNKDGISKVVKDFLLFKIAFD